MLLRGGEESSTPEVESQTLVRVSNLVEFFGSSLESFILSKPHRRFSEVVETAIASALAARGDCVPRPLARGEITVSGMESPGSAPPRLAGFRSLRLKDHPAPHAHRFAPAFARPPCPPLARPAATAARKYGVCGGGAQASLPSFLRSLVFWVLQQLLGQKDLKKDQR